MDISRIIQVYVVQGFIAVFFLYLAYNIFKRDRKRLNLLFGLSFIFVTIGLINNMIYALIQFELALLVFNFITNFSVGFGLIFLTIFNLILLRSEKVITVKVQNLIILVYGILLFSMIIFLPLGGMTINETTNYRAVWSLPYYLYVIIVISIGGVIPTLITSVIIYIQFTDVDLKKRWKYFIIGTSGLYIYMYGAFTTNLLNIELLRLIWSVVSLSIVIFIYLMYYGVGRQLER